MGAVAIPLLYLIPFQGLRYLVSQALSAPDVYMPFTRPGSSAPV